MSEGLVGSKRWLAVACIAVAVILVAWRIAENVQFGSTPYEKKVAARDSAVAALKELGLEPTKTQASGDFWLVDFSGREVTDDMLKYVKDLDKVGMLNLKKSTVTDAQLAHVNDVGAVAYLDLSDTAITDAGLEKLNGLVLLLNLNLSGTKVTKAGVQRFKKQRRENAKIPVQFKSPKVQF